MEAVALKKSGVVECAYVQSEVAAKEGLTYFSSPIELGVQKLILNVSRS